MHRPNRIGSHHIVDLSSDIDTGLISAANWPTTLGTTPVYQVQTESAVVGEKAACLNWQLDPTATYVTAAGKSFAIGRFISGEHRGDLPMIYTVSGSAIIGLNGGVSDRIPAFRMGRLDSGSVTVDHTAAVNQVTNSYELPSWKYAEANHWHIDCQHTVVDGLFQGDASAYSSQPVAFFLGFDNEASGAINIEFLKLSLSIFRWSGSLDTFDPTR